MQEAPLRFFSQQAYPGRTAETIGSSGCLIFSIILSKIKFNTCELFLDSFSKLLTLSLLLDSILLILLSEIFPLNSFSILTLLELSESKLPIIYTKAIIEVTNIKISKQDIKALL